jgi:hypothetical protein
MSVHVAIGAPVAAPLIVHVVDSIKAVDMFHLENRGAVWWCQRNTCMCIKGAGYCNHAESQPCRLGASCKMVEFVAANSRLRDAG